MLLFVVATRSDIKAVNFNGILYLNSDTITNDTTKNDSLLNKKEFFYQIQEKNKQELIERYISTDSSKRRPYSFIGDPSIYKRSIDYDYSNKKFFYRTSLSDKYKLSESKIYSLEDYVKENQTQTLTEYWRDKSAEDAGLHKHSGIVPEISFGGKLFDAIFGSNRILIKPQGSAELTLGVKINEVDNPTIPESLRRNVMMDFREHIQVNVAGSIGDRLKMDINYNTQATFDFENNVKLTYEGKEDDIVKEVEAGNVSLPLSGTLITGGQNLFGFKTKMQFGKLNVTTLFSQQKGETSVVNLEKGAQKKEFTISAVDYEVNRHFFISKYFKDNYNKALLNLPVINSPIVITKIEVWVTNKNANFEKSRNIVAFTDLGESAANVYNKLEVKTKEAGIFPDNDRNNLYDNLIGKYSAARNINEVTSALAGKFVTIKDYEKLENAKLLSSSEYSFHPQLGYISLNRTLSSDEVLAVAYEYTVRGDIIPKRVGEFSNDGPSAPSTLYLKLLKATTLSPNTPHWTLMMKNIYNIGAYGTTKDDFQLNIMYRNDEVGTNLNYISTSADSKSNPKVNGQILLKILNLDRLDRQLEQKSDGQFDYIEGITISSRQGRIIFPVLEPFGESLRSKFDDKVLAEKYVFDEIYSKSQSDAKQLAEKNKFNLEGTYKSSSNSEISLNSSNIKPGAVKVVAGSRELVENIDYTVDYAMGKVKIINQGILESGTPIRISSESNSLFSMQTKTLIGTHLDYNVNENLNLGATILHLSESPLTRKVNIGKEPISNTIWGVNGSFVTESGFITKMIDAIPFIDTKVKSKFSVDAEFAHFIPGHNGNVNEAYVDDFEGSKISISLKSPYAWMISSVPINDNIDNMFPENPLMLVDTLASGYNRAKLAWYSVDPLFYRTEDPAMPSYIKNNPDLRSDHYVREIKQTELFPNKEIAVGDANIISAMNIAFYPKERGPYNYTVRGLNKNGELKNPENSWGGIMRRIQSSDFESANVQYIEFWLLDPFINNVNNSSSGGKLYFDLGEISEDVLRDSRKSFENGLPTSEVIKNVAQTAWGRVPRIQSLVNGFDNNAQSRKYQDVGLDGLSTEDEKLYFQEKFQYLDKIRREFGEDSKAYKLAIQDPSADNYHYYRGSDYDRRKLDIASRYKNYSNQEGNSPTTSMSDESYSTSATTQPDMEDINQDNTLNESESYFRYEVDLDPSKMDINKNKYISDIRKATVGLPNGRVETVNWYQFKIPITKENAKVIGDIEGFKSIRFVRMFLKGFKDSINLRMASLGLVRDNWRMYDNQNGEADYNTQGSIEVSSVSLEENAEKQPINYVLPPGINRDLNASNAQYTQMNERAMLLKVRDLADGDYRSVFKNVTLDMIKYRRIKMDVHAEEISGTSLNDDDLKVFIRIGSDFKHNYYEYELPLKVTAPGLYGSSDIERRQVWPDLNRIDIPLEYFQRVKLARNDSRRSRASNVSNQQVFSKTIGELENNNNLSNSKNIISVVGNPTLAEVKTIMIGVRNTKDRGDRKSGEIWVNELRLSDFDESGGWAANVRMNARLADFATVTLAGRKIAPGFGSIDQKISQISREDQFQYDFSTNVQLGKFFPDSWRLRVPMYYAISENTILPQYDPVDSDIKLSNKLNRYSGSKRDSIRRNAETYVSRKSLNFTNVGVENSGESKLIDIANLSVSYSYNETRSRDVKTSLNLEKNYRGAISYVYSGRAKNITPFKNISFLKSPYLSLIRDFNFYFLPSQISVRTDIMRRYHEVQGRNLDNPLLKIDPSYDKNIDWNRYYDLKFDLAKSLKFDFSASSMAKVDEPDGMVDYDRDRDGYKRWRDTVLNNILNGGRAMHYNHNFTVSYDVPINKLPLLSWVNANARYTGTYDWQAGPELGQGVILGNEIKNSGSKQINTRFNLLSVYNNINWLKKVNDNYSGRGSRTRAKRVKFIEKVQDIKQSKKLVIKHGLRTDDVRIRVYDKSNKRIIVKYKSLDKNNIEITPSVNIKEATVEVSGTVKDSDNIIEKSAGLFARMMMSIRNISFAYTENNNTTMPGYLPSSSYFGTNDYMGSSAPGFNFITGLSDSNYALYAAKKGWITKDASQNMPFAYITNNVFSGRASVELFNGFNINFTVRRTFSNSNSQYISFNKDLNRFESSNKIETGGFSMTYISLSSAFFSIGKETDASESAYNKFLSNRKIESHRLARAKYGEGVLPDEKGFYKGYGANSQEVLIPSFLSAYGMGKSKNLFPSIWSILPNWSIRYSGLRKLDFIKKYFQSFNINHSYSCVYNVGSYMTNSFYGIKDINEITKNVYSQYDVSSVSIEERFNPLINIDMVWNNSFTTRFEVNRTRSLALSITNSQLAENSSNEFIVGLGYRFKHLPIIIKQTEVDNDLNLRCDFSLRKNNSIIRKIEENVSQLTSGQQVMSIKVSADYTLNNRFNVRMFYDRVVNDPYVSLSYRTINSNIGLSVRFTLIE